MKRVLFVCIENACRSQMAEAFAQQLGAGRVEAFSAGSRPANTLHPATISYMAERGCDLRGRMPKPLSALEGRRFDAVVAMGCGDACPGVSAVRREGWAVPDPKALTGDAFRAVRDGIEHRVRELLAGWGVPA